VPPDRATKGTPVRISAFTHSGCLAARRRATRPAKGVSDQNCGWVAFSTPGQDDRHNHWLTTVPVAEVQNQSLAGEAPGALVPSKTREKSAPVRPQPCRAMTSGGTFPCFSPTKVEFHSVVSAIAGYSPSGMSESVAKCGASSRGSLEPSRTWPTWVTMGITTPLALANSSTGAMAARPSAVWFIDFTTSVKLWPWPKSRPAVCFVTAATHRLQSNHPDPQAPTSFWDQPRRRRRRR